MSQFNPPRGIDHKQRRLPEVVSAPARGKCRLAPYLPTFPQRPAGDKPPPWETPDPVEFKDFPMRISREADARARVFKPTPQPRGVHGKDGDGVRLSRFEPV